MKKIFGRAAASLVVSFSPMSLKAQPTTEQPPAVQPQKGFIPDFADPKAAQGGCIALQKNESNEVRWAFIANQSTRYRNIPVDKDDVVFDMNDASIAIVHKGGQHPEIIAVDIMKAYKDPNKIPSLDAAEPSAESLRSKCVQALTKKLVI